MSIKFEHTEVMGWEAAIRGMRNPMNSWENSDSGYKCPYLKPEVGHTPSCCRENMYIGPNDLDLMKRLCNAGTDHRKFMRMITVYVDITAPLYWWKEFDTYKVGTVANSCSTMHKIADKEFTIDDFSHEHLIDAFRDSEYANSLKESKGLAAVSVDGNVCYYSPKYFIQMTCDVLNRYRELYLETKDKAYWWQMIQLLPSSYNQKRTVMMNYEVLANIYKSRKNHKLDEWAEHKAEMIDITTSEDLVNGDHRAHLVEGVKEYFGFCDWIKTLPYSELITGTSLSDIPIANEIMEEAKKRLRELENPANVYAEYYLAGYEAGKMDALRYSKGGCLNDEFTSVQTFYQRNRTD